MKEASGLEFAFEQSGGRTVRAKKDATSGAFDSKRRSHHAGNYSGSPERRQVEVDDNTYRRTRGCFRWNSVPVLSEQEFPAAGALEGTSGPRSSRSGNRVRSRTGSTSCDDGRGDHVRLCAG